MSFSDLKKGAKVHVHVTLYEKEVEYLDAIRDAHRASRAAVIGAMIEELKDADLSRRISAGYRSGAGQPRKD